MHGATVRKYRISPAALIRSSAIVCWALARRSDLYVRQERAVLSSAVQCLQDLVAAVAERKGTARAYTATTPTSMPNSREAVLR